MASSFRIRNSSIGIPSPPLALFVVIKGKKYTSLLFFLLGAWNVDLMAGTGAAILDHILGRNQHIEKQQGQRMLWVLDPMELLY